ADVDLRAGRHAVARRLGRLPRPARGADDVRAVSVHVGDVLAVHERFGHDRAVGEIRVVDVESGVQHADPNAGTRRRAGVRVHRTQTPRVRLVQCRGGRWIRSGERERIDRALRLHDGDGPTRAGDPTQGVDLVGRRAHHGHAEVLPQHAVDVGVDLFMRLNSEIPATHGLDT